MITESIKAYNESQIIEYQEICDKLATIIDQELSESSCKIWHAHPVWFINDNPIVGYSIQKPGVRLMFWSGVDFNELALNILGAKFKDASIFYKNAQEIVDDDLKRWLQKSTIIQWDYKNIVKKKGKLDKLNL